MRLNVLFPVFTAFSVAFTASAPPASGQTDYVKEEAYRELKEVDCSIAEFSDEIADFQKVRLTRLAESMKRLKAVGVAEADIIAKADTALPVIAALYRGDEATAFEKLPEVVSKGGVKWAEGRIDDQINVLATRVAAYARKKGAKELSASLTDFRNARVVFGRFAGGVGLLDAVHTVSKNLNQLWLAKMKSDEIKRQAARADEDVREIESQMQAAASVVNRLLDSRELVVERYKTKGVIIPPDYFTEQCAVEQEGFDGVWRVKPELGVAGDVVIQVEGNKFWLSVGGGMSDCGVVESQFDLLDKSEAIGRYNGSCADLNMAGKVALQRHDETTYTMTMCLSAAFGTPDECNLGYGWAIERADELALK